MERLTTEELLTAIRNEDRRVLSSVYKSHYPSIRKFITSNSGNECDAQDIFQDALVVIFLKLKVSIPKLNCTFGTYLFSVCKYLWYKELRVKRRHSDQYIELDELIDLENNFLKAYIKMEKRKLVLEHFYELQDECQRLLKMYVNEIPIIRIMKLMGYSSEQYTRNRRLACKERLIRRIWNSPRYKELRNEAYREDNKVPRW